MKLVLPKACGGIGLPDLQHYYQAVHLAQIVDWKVHIQCKDWVTLENLISNSDLHYAPWLSREHVPPNILTHPLIGATLHEFDRAWLKVNINVFSNHQ